MAQALGKKAPGTPGTPARAPSRLLAGLWWHGGVLEGGVAAAMVAGTAALAGWPLDRPLLLLAFCGTLLVYHLDRTPALSPEDRHHHPERWRWRKTHGGAATALAAAAATGAVGALPHLRSWTLGAGALLAVPAAAYALPVPGSGSTHRFKDIGVAKPFVVAAAWAAASVAFPALEASPPEAGGALAGGMPAIALLAGYRFLFVVPNLLLADAAEWAPASHHAWSRRWLAAGGLALAVAGGTLALGVFAAPLSLAADLAGPALLLAALAAGQRGRRLVRVADCAMYAPALAALLAAGYG